MPASRPPFPFPGWTLHCILAALLLAAPPARAADYHLAPTGDDKNPGTADAPFATLKKGMSILKPGDTLLVKNGTYHGVIDYGAFPSGESWERPVTVATQSGHRPVIVPPKKGEACLYIVGAAYLVFDGLVFDAQRHGQGIGITWGTGFPQAHHLEFRNCEVKDSLGQGILTGGDGCRFINLDVHDNGTDGLTHGIYLSAADCLIDGGRYYRNVGWGIHVYPKATNTVVRNTRCYENGATGLGLVWGANNTAYNNVVYHNGAGIHLSGDAPRAYNNTAYGNRGEGISVANADNGASGTKNADVRNNIAFRNGDGQVADYATGAGTTLANNFTADPVFMDAAAGDFRLRKGSPAIDAGADLRKRGVDSDIEGHPRSQGKAFDAGAHEFVPPRKAATGPLRVHPDNPRYFTDGSKNPDGSPRVVYLTGSHTWNNLQDSRTGDEPPAPFDYAGYLKLMRSRGHNFMRLWAWEGGVNQHRYEPLPYVKTPSGKYDLDHFDPAYFDRLRSRVAAARDDGVYVSVMLFQGWSIYSHGYGNPWPVHPYNKANNVNGIDGDADKDGEGKEVHSLAVPAITRLQEAYLRKVVDTVNDLDNVLYEVTNETANHSKEWQYHVIRYVKEYESKKQKQHPVGMTYFDSGPAGTMDALLASPADWISPGDDGGRFDYQGDPPPADGRKVSIADTDHIYGTGGDATWVWKSFTRGYNPIYMDPLKWDRNLRVGDADMEGARRAMGQTLRVAGRMTLAATKPAGELASTKFCLAAPGREYLAYLPEGGTITIDLSAAKGGLSAEWIHPTGGLPATSFHVAGGAKRELAAPFAGAAVLYLKAPAQQTTKAPAKGPLRVHPDNPRYFTDGTGRAVYLTGSHTWNVLQSPDPSEGNPLDYGAYLDLLGRHHHNFFRLWTRMGTGGGPTPSPTIYRRTGPGNAHDGRPKYDLTQFNEPFFQRLRERVKAAGDRGVYVAVMFFAGDNVVDVGGNPNWPLHPYHRNNNVNGINGDPNGDGQGLECYRLDVPAITKLQERYVKKVIDTVGDLDNVLWEVGNELPGTLEFANHIVRLVKEHERTRPKQHPVGISTFADAKPPMKDFGDTAADWVTPDLSSGGDYQGDPPAADGKKVVISDTDHLWGVGGGPDWVWKSFTRGLHPIYMDPLDDDETRQAARRAMGHTRRFAERMNLAAMTPQNRLASTGFCLADPGSEYLVFQPKDEKFAVELAGGTYSVEWFNVGRDSSEVGGKVTGGGSRSFEPPFEGPAVLYLKAESPRKAAAGPLRVHPTNGRYFTDGIPGRDSSPRAVYLTGSHTWPNLIDRGPTDPPPKFDFDWYLKFLSEHDHNFIRLWSRHVTWYHDYGDKRVLYADPLAWPRTGPGAALDGKPKVDLSRFNDEYFARLRNRVKAANELGIYVGIMLFGGHYECTGGWRGNPFNAANNINGVNGDPDGNGEGLESHTLDVPAVNRIQEAYLRKVIDTVNEFDNVLFEISNEGDASSKKWQYHLIRLIKDYEAGKPKQHPVGMTSVWDSDNNALYSSDAEWVSPQVDHKEVVTNLRTADGRKVSLLDSDHWFIPNILNNADYGRDWVWMAFCRGHNPILMEQVPVDSGSEVPVTTNDPGHAASRRAMGQTRKLSRRVNLAAMTPQSDLASTTYCLADPGHEYVVYQPRDGTFAVRLTPGSYTAEWFDVSRDSTKAGSKTTGGGTQTFEAPFDGPAVLYLKRQSPQ